MRVHWNTVGWIAYCAVALGLCGALYLYERPILRQTPPPNFAWERGAAP